MAAVIRIKRRLNEDPLDAVLLNCKRRKTEEASSTSDEDLSAVLKFAGTVNDPKDVFKHIKKPTKEETQEQFKKRTANVVAKLRQERQALTKKNRFKIINSFRSNAEQPNDNVECTIVDIESENKNGETKSTEPSDPQYVYDLYYTSSDDFGEVDLNELISVYPLSDGAIYDARDDVYNNESDHDSEDSNAENNWRNDYPDESDMADDENDDNSINEGNMLHAMHRVTLNDDDLSSDDYDGAFGYDRDDCEDHGSDYSSFKTRIKKQMTNDFCYYDEYDDSCTP